MATRVYVPVSVDGLVDLSRTARLPAGLPAYAVTEGLRRADPSAQEEELEYDALCDAGEADLGPRTVVLAADLVPDVGAVRQSPFPLPADVPLRHVVSLHVSEAGADPDDELLWYDVTELPAVVEELSAG